MLATPVNSNDLSEREESRSRSLLPDVPSEDNLKRVKFHHLYTQCQIGQHYTACLVNMLRQVAQGYSQLSKTIQKSVSEELDNIRKYTDANKTNLDNMICCTDSNLDY